MKTLLTIALALTFTTAAFADCRIAFMGTASSHISKMVLIKKGYKLIKVSELSEGDFLAEVELEKVSRTKNRFTSNYKTHLNFEQVVSRLDAEGFTTVQSSEIKSTLQGWAYDDLFESTAVGKLRAQKLPRCSKVKN